MTTLAEINQTLLQQVELMTEQGKSIQKTSDSIAAVKKSIANVLIQQRSDRLDEIETKREAKKKQEVITRPSGFLQGFSQGTGFSWLSDFFGSVFRSLLGTGGSLLGKLTGFIGLAAGKLLVWGAIGGLIANFFGDEIKAFAEKFKEITGIDIDAELEKTGYKEEILAAVTVALGALTLGVTKALAKLTGRALFALGSAGLGMLGFGPKGAPTAPKQSTTGRKPTGPSKSTTPTLLDKNGKPLKGTALIARQNALARAAEQSRPSSKILSYLGKAAPTAKALVKKIPFIGNAVAAGFGYIDEDYEKAGYGGVDRAALGIGESVAELGDLATYLGAEASNYLFGTELGSTDLAGAYKRAVTSDLGSALLQLRLGDAYDAMAAPTGDVNAQAAVAPNRLEARKKEEERRKAKAKLSSIIDVSRGDNPYANLIAGAIDPVALQGRIAAFQAYGVDRDRQRMSATERGLAKNPPSTGVGLAQMAANARMSVMINNAPQITNITNNNGGGGNTSVMTVPVGTADVSDRRDTIRRYGYGR